MSVFLRYYKSLTPRSRLILGGGLITWALVGTLTTNTIGSLPGWENTEEERERLWKTLGAPTLKVLERDDEGTAVQGIRRQARGREQDGD